MRTNYNRTTGETKNARKENRKPIDANDLLIETPSTKNIALIGVSALRQSGVLLPLELGIRLRSIRFEYV
jgi:hypothetical protein